MSTYSAVMKLVDNVSSTATKINGSMQRLNGGIKGVGEQFTDLGNILMAGAIIGGITKLVGAFKEQESANLKASQSAYAFGQQMGYTQEQIDDLYNTMQGNAGNIQDNGIFGDEALLEAQSLALQMGFNKEQMTELTKASADMTAKMKGANATGEDLNATQKALAMDIKNGTSRSFKSLGLALTENEKALYKNMNEQERYAFIMEKVKNASAGADEQVRKSTVGGRLLGIANNIGDIIQEVARLVLGFGEFNNSVPSWLADLDDGIKDFKNNLALCTNPLDAIILAFNTLHSKYPVLTDIAMGVATIIGLIKAWTIATQIVTTAQAIFNAICALNPIVAIITGAIIAFTALTAILDAFGITWGDVWDACVNIFNSIMESVKNGFQKAVDFIKGIWNKFIDFFATIAENSPMGMLINKLLELSGSSITIRGIVENAQVTQEHNALGTSYFKGGLTHINERNQGEVVNLPNGSQIVPHDVAVKQSNAPVYNVNVTVQGNVIGNEEYINDIGNSIVQKLQLSMNNT